jgi:hypothetical protein
VDQFGKLGVVDEVPQTRYVAVGDADVAYQDVTHHSPMT